MIPFFFTRYHKAPLATVVSFLASLNFVGTLLFTVGYLLNWSGLRDEMSLGESLLIAAILAVIGFALKKLAEFLARRKQSKLQKEAAASAPNNAAPDPVKAAPDPAKAAPDPAKAAPRAEVPTQPRGSYCPNCGAKLPPEAKFCSHCGTAVSVPGEAERKQAPPAENNMSLDELLRLANQYAEAEDYQRELDLLRQAQAQHPQVPGIYNQMGIAYRQLGDHAKAMECYSRASELDPNNGTFLTNTGVALLCDGKPEEALPWFERGLPLMKKSNPGEYPRALGNYAMALGDAGYADNAVRCLKEATQLGYPNAEFVRKHLESLGIYYH